METTMRYISFKISISSTHLAWFSMVANKGTKPIPKKNKGISGISLKIQKT